MVVTYVCFFLVLERHLLKIHCKVGIHFLRYKYKRRSVFFNIVGALQIIF